VLELGPGGIRVVGIASGLVETPLRGTSWTIPQFATSFVALISDEARS
jgi:NAD(P)-dependent dehydrogenase (short-subunit alcohol dehydrogenase family)